MFTYKIIKFQSESNHTGVKRVTNANPVTSTPKQANSIPSTSKQSNPVPSTSKTTENARSSQRTAGKQADDEENRKRAAQGLSDGQVFIGIFVILRDFLDVNI